MLRLLVYQCKTVKGVPGCQKNTWGRLNIFVHQRWTYLPPRDLCDVILPNLVLF